MKETYKIPEERMHYLKRKLAQINKRAVKLGLVEISMEVGAVSSEKYKDEFGYDKHRSFYTVTVTGQTPMVDGWSFRATLNYEKDPETGETFVLVKSIPDTGVEVPKHYRHSNKDLCDHCHTSRNRKNTYLIEKDGEWMQVGKACLKDFFPTNDPHELASSCKYLLDFSRLCSEESGNWGA